MLAIAKSQKIASNYFCKNCDYTTSNLYDFNKHNKTQKHLINDKSILSMEKSQKSQHECSCGKTYKDNSGLWRHKKTCINPIIIPPTITENVVIQDASANEIKVLTNLVLEVVKTNTELQKQNHDLQKQVLDVCQKIQPSSSSTINSNNTITNSHNKTFNLNFFLNEQCKDAMNIKDFVKSIKIDISDLERLGKEGYVEGFSRIILERLKEMDIYKRPLHCSDAKRETMYIKENDVWNKDESANNEKMIEFIKAVEQRNYTSLLAYADEYPEVYKQESKRNVPYLHMAMQSNGTAEKINKVMKRIIKEVVINKETN